VYFIPRPVRLLSFKAHGHIVRCYIDAREGPKVGTLLIALNLGESLTEGQVTKGALEVPPVEQLQAGTKSTTRNRFATLTSGVQSRQSRKLRRFP